MIYLLRTGVFLVFFSGLYSGRWALVCSPAGTLNSCPGQDRWTAVRGLLCEHKCSLSCLEGSFSGKFFSFFFVHSVQCWWPVVSVGQSGKRHPQTPKTTCKNDPITGGGELFSIKSSSPPLSEEGVMWPLLCEIHKWETKVAFILLPRSTIKPTFWCRHTERRAWRARRARRPGVAFTFLNETGFIHPGLGLKYYSALRIKRMEPQVLLQWEIWRNLRNFFYFFKYFDYILYIFRLGSVFMNCSVWRQWSGWWVGGRWRSCIIHEEGGQSFSSLTEKLCSWSGSTASRLLTWYFRDSDINCRSALGIILQRNFWDFEGRKKNAEMTKRRSTDWLYMWEVGPKLSALNHTNMNL